MTQQVAQQSSVGNLVLAKTDSARRGDDAMKQVLDAYRADIGSIVPSHINGDTFMGLAMAYVRRDAYLSTAAASNPLSLIVALREVAALGHVPMKGTCALVAFRSNKDGDNGWSITCVEEVGGVLQRIFRAGGVTTVHCDVVREADRARFQRTKMILPEHDYDEYADPAERGPLKAVYAYATLLNGQPSTVVWMPKGVVMKHRNASKSATKDKTGGNFWGPAWPEEGPWTEDMWKKTAVHKLSTLVPSSSEYRWQMAQTEAAAASRFAGVTDAPTSAVAGGGTDWIDGDSFVAQEQPQRPDGASQPVGPPGSATNPIVSDPDEDPRGDPWKGR